MDLDLLRRKVSEGADFQVLQKQFPLLTIAAYKRLGGGYPAAKGRYEEGGRVDVGNARNSGDASGYYSRYLDRLLSLYTPPARVEFLIRSSLYGDGHVATPEGVASPSVHCYYTEGHAIGQLPLVLYKASLLGDRLARIRYEARLESGNGRDDVAYLFSTSCPEASAAHRSFYEETEGGWEKRLDRPELFESFDLESLAVWVMDDGKHYSGNRFSLSLGLSERKGMPYVQRVAKLLSDSLGEVFRVMRTSEKGVELVPESPRIQEKLAPYLLPWFSYKMGMVPSSCGKGLDEDFVRAILQAVEGYRHRCSEEWNTMGQEARVRMFISSAKVTGIPRGEKPTKSLVDKARRVSARAEDGGILRATNRYNGIASWFFPHRYTVRCGNSRTPEEVLARSSRLRRVAELQAKSGDGFQPANIRNAICAYGGKVAGQFNPIIARWFYARYSGEGARVLDPCAGWGGRLLGAHMAGRAYRGVDASTATVESLKGLSSFLGADASVVHGDSSEMDLGEEEYAMALTSPPYFDYEEYSQDPEQSCIKYPEFQQWEEGFLAPMFALVRKALVPRGVFVVNFGGMKGLMEAAQRSALGYDLVETFRSGAPGMYQRKKGYEEFYLVFRKKA